MISPLLVAVADEVEVASTDTDTVDFDLASVCVEVVVTDRHPLLASTRSSSPTTATTGRQPPAWSW
jgi:hypothetical protein